METLMNKVRENKALVATFCFLAIYLAQLARACA